VDGSGSGPVTPPATSCIATGGTYDGVAFTKDEECHAVDFLNDARFSEMAALPDAARLAAYYSGPDGACCFQSKSAWSTVAEFANHAGVGSTALGALKTSAATWTQNGLPYDTVATTFTNRAKLVNLPIYLDKVYVNNALTTPPAGYQCVEVRDSPTATNYLFACIAQYVCLDLNTTPFEECFPSGRGVGAWVSMHGTLRTGTISGSGGYRLNLNEPASSPNPKVP